MTDFTIKAAETEADFFAARRMSSRVFRGDDPAVVERDEAWMRQLQTMPGFDYSWYRLGICDGQVVTNVGAYGYQLRYGQLTIPFGAIGSVSTHPDYRKRGYASTAMNNAREYMKERGDLIALLGTGLDGFYTTLDYHNVWPDNQLEFDAEAAAQLESSSSLRPATPDDTEQMAALYEQQWAHRVARVRSPEMWHWRMNTAPRNYMRVVEDAGVLVGYIAAHDNIGRWAEVVVSTSAALRTIMSEVGRLNQEAGNETIYWNIAPDDRLIYYARSFMNVKVHTFQEAKKGWMGTIINPVGLRDALLPEVLEVSGVDESQLIFEIDADTVKCGLYNQPPTQVELPHSQFLPLMFGSLPPAALEISPEAAALLARLFPPRVSQFAEWDWF